MNIWLLALILVTLIVLCGGSGWPLYKNGYGVSGALLGVLGLILFIVLVVIVIFGTGMLNAIGAPATHTH